MKHFLVFTISLTCLNFAQAACNLSSDVLAQNKKTAQEMLTSKKIELYVLQGQDLNELKKVSIFKDIIINEFNHDSAMRDLVGQELADLSDNGRNSGEGIEIVTREGLYCNYISAKTDKVKIVRLKGSSDDTQLLQAQITFTDGYHGGQVDVTMKFNFEAKTEWMSKSISNKKGMPLYTVKMDYPKLISVTRSDE